MVKDNNHQHKIFVKHLSILQHLLNSFLIKLKTYLFVTFMWSDVCMSVLFDNMVNVKT